MKLKKIKKSKGDKRKGKGKSRDSDDGVSADEDDGDKGLDKKKGRISKKVKAQALAIREEYHKKLEALAEKEGKSVGALLHAVGDVVRDNRGLNRWNAFQAYATHPEGLHMERKEGQSDKEFQKEIRALYRQKRDGNEEEFERTMTWYKQMIATQTAEKCFEGLSEKELHKLAEPLINRVSSINSNYTINNNLLHFVGSTNV